MVFSQQLFVNTWPIVKAFQKTHRNHVHEVFIATFIFRQQQEMKIGITNILAPQCFVFSAARSNVCFNPKYRFDPRLGAFLVKLYRTEHHAVISQRQSFHIVRDSGFHKVIDTTCTIEQAVVGVIVKMDKIRHTVA